MLFPELAVSDTVVTNARGIFDRAMAEYVLGYMLSEVKGFRESWSCQAERNWHFRMTDMLRGSRAVIFGVGSIGREIGKLLKAVGVDVVGVGRRSRNDDPVFGDIHAQSNARDVVADADWVIGILPLTDQTRGIFDAPFFKAMNAKARFVNVGRGQSVVERDLVASLGNNEIAGAMRDVFEVEPLSDASPLWGLPNVVISPHMSGDYSKSLEDLVKQFLENLERYVAGERLENIVQKELGFVCTV